MKVIEDLVDDRFGLKGLPFARLVLDEDSKIILLYQDFKGPSKPPRKIGNIYLSVGDIRIRSEQILFLTGNNRTAFNPLLSCEDPARGKPFENSQEAVEAIRGKLDLVLARPRLR